MSQAGPTNSVNDNPQIPTSFITNSGIAIPSSNQLEILGSGDITTTGIGNVVTIDFSGAGLVSSITGTAPIQANGVSGTPEGGAVTVSVTNATTSTVGVASFNTTNFSVSGAGAVTSNNFTINTASPLSGGGSITLGDTLNLSISGTGFVSSAQGTAPITVNAVSGTPETGAVTIALTTPLALNFGGTNANLTASNGGIFYSTASAGAILSATATARQMLQSGASTTPAWSTTTWPTTTSINTIIYSSSASIIGQITASDNGVLISGTTGIPSWLAAGTTGQVLIATTSNPASWGTLSSIAVTSLTGTANQVLVNATSGTPETGALTVAFPATGGISIGSYQATTAPSGGILAPGNVAFGSSSANPSSVNNVRLYVSGGNLNIDNGYQLSLRSDVGTEASGGYWLGYDGSGTYGLATCINVANDASTRRQIMFTTSSNNAITGTLTAGVSIWPIIGGMNIGQSYVLNLPPTNGLLVQGNVGIGTTAPNSALQFANSITQRVITLYEVANNSFQYFGFGLLSGTLLSNVGGTTNQFQWAAATSSSASNILMTLLGTGELGILDTNPSANLSVVGNAQIGFASNTSAPADGLVVSGQVGIGTNSPQSSSILELHSSNMALLLPRLATPNTQVASPNTGMVAYNSNTNQVQQFNSSIWQSLSGLSFIQTQSVSNVASVIFSTSSEHPISSYNALFLVIEYLLPAVTSNTLELQVSQDNGSTYLASGYSGGQTNNTSSANANWTNTNTTSFVDFGGFVNTSQAWGYCYFGNFLGGDLPCFWGVTVQASGIQTLTCSTQTNTAFNAFKLFFSGGNISTGNFTLYGIIGAS